jgi:hypothetical protein
VILIEPDNVKGVGDYDSVNSAVLICRKAELPTRHYSEMIIELFKAIWSGSSRPIVLMVTE